MFGLAVPPGLAVSAAFLSFQFTNTVSLGVAILGAIAGAGTAVGIFYGVKYKTSYSAASAAATELRAHLHDELQRVERMESDLRESLELIGEQKKTIERLSALENIEVVVKLMAATADRQDERATERLDTGISRLEAMFDARLELHEDHASGRHEAQLAALAGIAAGIERLLERRA